MVNSEFMRMLTVLTDSQRIEKIRITCRCEHSWTEQVPGELHDSDVIMVFTCRCGQQYHLRNRVLTRVKQNKEDASHDRQQQQVNTRHYDA